ncbi:hypothetical protein VP01_5079g1 [Puccinia sorghi]|uniref:Uncharacterized protein n=1 Tax=Puccinia sorghi TaxID=27349 RepID=A0A0L6UNG3_9BASI|nr:hypothetical protein VP01_5079g1 [Puccinia sorghi]
MILTNLEVFWKPKGLPFDLDDIKLHSMEIGNDLVSQLPTFDTSASHGFTGSKLLLNHFRLLSKRIPVSVATNQGSAFITGYGYLKFWLHNGQS